MSSRASDPASRAPSSDLAATQTNMTPSPIFANEARLAGRFRVRERLGAGGMGIVYLAFDENLEIEVAIKVLRPEIGDHGFERFRREVLLARQVTHENVVRMHDLIVENDLLLLSMDYIAGRSLKERLKETGRLGLDQALAITEQIASGLEAAHQRGVIHRDLKPGNILLDEKGNAHVTDFGLAKSINTAALTEPGQVVGTLDYLSPEQAVGKAVDHRSDLYTLGLVLFEMLSGGLPFGASPPPVRLTKRLATEPDDLSELGVAVPDFVRDILCHCLALDPAERYQSAAELKRDLQRRNRSDPEHGRSKDAPRSERTEKEPVAFDPSKLVAVLVTVAAVLIAGWLVLRPSDSSVSLSTPQAALAVLPFQDQAAGPEATWASIGFAESLATALAENERLRVVDFMRALRLAAELELPRGPLPPTDLRSLGELLDVDRVLLGSVRRAGDRVRIEARLIKVGEKDFPAEPFVVEADRDAEARSLVRELADELQRHLVAGFPRRPILAGSHLPEAREAYSQGLEQLARGEGDGAAALLSEAVELDPSFVAAWTRLSIAFSLLGDEEKALLAARSAVELLSHSTADRASYLTLAHHSRLAGELAQARSYLELLLRAYPHDTEGRVELAEVLAAEEKLDEAIEQLQIVVGEEPHHPRAWYLLGRFALLAGDPERAANEYLVRALVIQNRLGDEQGRAEVERALEQAEKMIEHGGPGP